MYLFIYLPMYIYILIFVYIPHIVNKLPAQRAQRSVTIYVFHVCVYIYMYVLSIYLSQRLRGSMCRLGLFLLLRKNSRKVTRHCSCALWSPAKHRACLSWSPRWKALCSSRTWHWWSPRTGGRCWGNRRTWMLCPLPSSKLPPFPWRPSALLSLRRPPCHTWLLCSPAPLPLPLPPHWGYSRPHRLRLGWPWWPSWLRWPWWFCHVVLTSLSPPLPFLRRTPSQPTPSQHFHGPHRHRWQASAPPRSLPIPIGFRRGWQCCIVSFKRAHHCML